MTILNYLAEFNLYSNTTINNHFFENENKKMELSISLVEMIYDLNVHEIFKYKSGKAIIDKVSC